MLGLVITIMALGSLSKATDNCGGKSDECASDVDEDSDSFDQDTDWSKATSIYQFHANDINGQNVSLEKYEGHVLIIVNVASNCALTENNYKQLELLYEKYGVSNGLRILAFPSNQFASQEPGTSSQILDFVKQYNVQFDMFEKVNVNGETAHPLWKWLKKQASSFITDDIKWNFTKFLVDKQGQVALRFSPTTEPFFLEDSLKLHF